MTIILLPLQTTNGRLMTLLAQLLREWRHPVGVVRLVENQKKEKKRRKKFFSALQASITKIVFNLQQY